MPLSEHYDNLPNRSVRGISSALLVRPDAGRHQPCPQSRPCSGARSRRGRASRQPAGWWGSWSRRGKEVCDRALIAPPHCCLECALLGDNWSGRFVNSTAAEPRFMARDSWPSRTGPRRLGSLAAISRVAQSSRVALVEHLPEDRVGIALRAVGAKRVAIVHPGEDDDLRSRVEAKEEPKPLPAKLSPEPVLPVCSERVSPACTPVVSGRRACRAREPDLHHWARQ